MKIAVNKAWGGFSLPHAIADMLGIDSWTSNEEDRANPALIEALEESGDLGTIEIIEIPEEVTDWHIFEYDGYESVWYVLDGKMYNK